MIKKREMKECELLFPLMLDPLVYPFVRHKVKKVQEYKDITRRELVDEEKGLVISRTIINEEAMPIGTITLFDVEDGTGFLGTWIGTIFQGRGYNLKAKHEFFNELFFIHDIKKIYLKIRKVNEKSKRANEKMGLAYSVNHIEEELYRRINKDEEVFDLYCITKENYLIYMMNQQNKKEQIDPKGEVGSI